MFGLVFFVRDCERDEPTRRGGNNIMYGGFPMLYFQPSATSLQFILCTSCPNPRAPELLERNDAPLNIIDDVRHRHTRPPCSGRPVHVYPTNPTYHFQRHIFRIKPIQLQSSRGCFVGRAVRETDLVQTAAAVSHPPKPITSPHGRLSNVLCHFSAYTTNPPHRVRQEDSTSSTYTFHNSGR